MHCWCICKLRRFLRCSGERVLKGFTNFIRHFLGRGLENDATVAAAFCIGVHDALTYGKYRQISFFRE